MPRDWDGDTTSAAFARWRATEVARLERERRDQVRFQAELRARQAAERAGAITRCVDLLVEPLAGTVSDDVAQTLARRPVERLFTWADRDGDACRGCLGYGDSPRERAHFVIGLLRQHTAPESLQ
ncbi:hypothetical protein [Xylanimonas ulmi]|uniref:Uncharacterized protein n=1 Tax=Xylanimonas ulmi TaxID=228973 RepID=A0A4V2EY98_9MICO|nr:hypothetical protein [Xylanibacterium ulmi]RZS62240.1 hypothetical protein EV386_2565 [Xylanibacterium ulmi]